MSILKVANVHLETTGTNRIDYNSNGFTNIVAGGTGGIIVNVGGVALINVTPSNTNITGNLFLNSKNVETYISSSFGAANAAFAKANAALANTTVTLSGDLTVTGNLTALSYNTSSDERLKQIINTAPLGVDSLEPKQYYMISEPGRIRYGFVAQEVQKIFPDLVSLDSNGLLVLNYMDIIALLLEDYKKTKERLIILENLIKWKDINTKKMYKEKV